MTPNSSCNSAHQHFELCRIVTNFFFLRKNLNCEMHKQTKSSIQPSHHSENKLKIRICVCKNNLKTKLFYFRC